MAHATLIPGVQVTLQSDFRSQGGVPLCRVPRYASLEWTEALRQGGRGQARLKLAMNDPARLAAAIFNVIRIDETLANGTVRTFEYRITELDDANPGPDIDILALPFITDFGRFQLRTVTGGVVSKVVNIAAMTPTEIIADIVLPAIEAEGYQGITLGTVTPTARLTASLPNATPLGILDWLEEQTAYDAYLTREGDSAWTLHLAALGIDAPAPVAMVGRNLVAVRRTIVVDDQFVTRVEADGMPRPGDTLPSRCGEAAWQATASGDVVLALSDPAGGPGPIGAAEQVTGKTALLTLEPVPLRGVTGPNGLALDSTRYVLWATWSNTLVWSGLTDGADGSLVVTGTNTPYLVGIAYAADVDRLYVADRANARILVINPATHTVASTIPIGSGVCAPLRLTYLFAIQRLVCCMDIGSETQARVIDVTTNTIVATLANSQYADTHATYHAGTNRLFLWAGTQGFYTVKYYNASTFAFGGYATGTTNYPHYQVTQDPTAGTVYIFTASGSTAYYQTFNPTTLTFGTPTALGVPTTAPFSLAPGVVPSAGGYHYPVIVISVAGVYSARLYAFNGTTTAATCGDIGATLSTVAFAPVASPKYFFAGSTALWGAVRWLKLGDAAPVPFDAHPILACDADAQTITLPAVAAGGPLCVRNGGRVQIRENANLDYLTRLTNPDGLATYGAVDAAPAYDTLGLTNYWRGGSFDDWRADDTSRWLTDKANSNRGTRWRTADKTALSGEAGTLTTAYTLAGLTLNVTGLAANRVLAIGDVFSTAAHYPVTPYYASVRQRTVCDANGAAAVPITGLNTSLPNGAAVYLYSPNFALAPGRTDAVILAAGDGYQYVGFAPVPHVVGNAVAWVVAHLQLWCLNLAPSAVGLYVYEPFAGDGAGTVLHPADTATITTGEVRDYWLAARVDLSSITGGAAIGFRLAPVPGGAVLVRSLAVVLAPNATTDSASGGALDVYGSEGSIGLWQLSNIRLAQGNVPTLNYRCEVVEDDPAKPFTLGALARLRDSTHGIAATPRLISVTRYGVGPDQKLRKPEIELSSFQTDLVRAVVALQRQVAA